MAVTTGSGKQTIDPPMSSGLENLIRSNDEVIGVSGELEEKTGKKILGTPNGDPHA